MAPEPTGPDDAASVGGQSLRPGSIVSNIEQRLDDIEVRICVPKLLLDRTVCPAIHIVVSG